MSLPPLDNLVRMRQLKTEAAIQPEIDGLLRSGNARLKDAQLKNLSLDSRFDLGYNVDQSLVDALIRVAQEVVARVVGMGPVVPGSVGAKQ